jgi:hypothetical protein
MSRSLYRWAGVAQLAVFLVLTASPAAAQQWPAKPITIINGFPAGAGNDIVMRMYQEALEKDLGTSLIFEYKPGAGGNVASEVVSKAAPDGYTLVLGTAGTHGINAALYKKLPFDVEADFTPIAPLRRNPNFRFQFLHASGGLRVSVSNDQGSLTLPVQWAFGAGDQAVTFVSQMNEDWYVEHHFSYYSSTHSLESTPGHHNHQATSLQDALGVLYKTFDPESRIMRCFQCHSTGHLSLGPKLDIVPAETGVRCEACHGPGSLHVEAARRAAVGVRRVVPGVLDDGGVGTARRGLERDGDRRREGRGRWRRRFRDRNWGR